MVKPRLASPDAAAARAAFRNLLGVFEAALRLLAPFMPFLTEELWHALYDGQPPLKSIALADYPQPDVANIDIDAETEMAILQDLIASVRNIRAELKAEPKLRVPIRVFAHNGVRRLIDENRSAIERLANVDEVSFVGEPLTQAAGSRSTARFDVAVVYEQKVDVAAERARLTKELERLERESGNAQRQLGNEQFLSKAPAAVVEGLRKRAQEVGTLLEKTRSALRELG
jgi:valyl-tRNA synthetase